MQMEHFQCNLILPSRIDESFFYGTQVECIISWKRSKYFVKAVEFSPRCDQTRLGKKEKVKTRKNKGKERKKVTLEMLVAPSGSGLLPGISQIEYLL